MASSRREDAKSMAWATPEPPIVSANDVNKIVFIFSPPFAGNVRAHCGQSNINSEERQIDNPYF
jgi:hypothetical protein